METITKYIDPAGQLKSSIPYVKWFFIILILGGVIIYFFYEKRRKEQSEPIYVADPRSGTIPETIENAKIPIPVGEYGYSIAFWFWVNNWEYKQGDFKHILHKGDKNGDYLQPGIWFDKNENNMVIRLDTTVKNKTFSFLENKVYSDAGGVIKEFKVRGTTLRKLQRECAESGCVGFTALVKNPRNLDSPVWGATMYKSGTVVSSTEVFEQVTAIRQQGYTLGSFIVDKTISNNPMNDKNVADAQSIVIPNIPLNRWVHFAMTVSDTHVEIYVNGLLVKTYSLKGNLQLNNGDLFLTMNGGFAGLLSNVHYKGHVMTTPEIQKLYFWGPDPWTWTNLVRKLTAMIIVPDIKVELPGIRNLLTDEQISQICTPK